MLPKLFPSWFLNGDSLRGNLTNKAIYAKMRQKNTYGKSNARLHFEREKNCKKIVSTATPIKQRFSIVWHKGHTKKKIEQ